MVVDDETVVVMITGVLKQWCCSCLEVCHIAHESRLFLQQRDCDISVGTTVDTDVLIPDIVTG